MRINWLKKKITIQTSNFIHQGTIMLHRGQSNMPHAVLKPQFTCWRGCYVKSRQCSVRPVSQPQGLHSHHVNFTMGSKRLKEKTNLDLTANNTAAVWGRKFKFGKPELYIEFWPSFAKFFHPSENCPHRMIKEFKQGKSLVLGSGPTSHQITKMMLSGVKRFA